MEPVSIDQQQVIDNLARKLAAMLVENAQLEAAIMALQAKLTESDAD